MLRLPFGLVIFVLLAVLAGCGGAPGSVSSNASQSSPAPDTTPGVPANAKTFSDLDQDNGWTGYGLLPSSYAICQSCDPNGPEITWSMTQATSSPALSGGSTRFDIGGQTPFADVLWNNHLIGDFSSQGLPDTSRTILPATHNFIYDVYFYGTSLETSQALEFDINQFSNGQGYIWGHECRIAGGHEWDTWDNVKAAWVPTGVPCNPTSNWWNHLTIQVQRTASNQLLFQSITLNGIAHQLNITRTPGSAPGWYGVTVNYQMDGNGAQQPYSVWLDKLNFTYW